MGKDVQKDDKQSVKWLRKAAKQGNAKYQYALGHTLWDLGGGKSCGKGLFSRACKPEYRGEGVYWLEEAEKNGSFRAKGILQKINEPTIEVNVDNYNYGGGTSYDGSCVHCMK